MATRRLHDPVLIRLESREALERGRYQRIKRLANRRTSRRRDEASGDASALRSQKGLRSVRGASPSNLVTPIIEL